MPPPLSTLPQVWGHVSNMSVVDAILARPFHEFKHPVGTVMRMMSEKIKFVPRAVKRGEERSEF